MTLPVTERVLELPEPPGDPDGASGVRHKRHGIREKLQRRIYL